MLLYTVYEVLGLELRPRAHEASTVPVELLPQSLD